MIMVDLLDLKMGRFQFLSPSFSSRIVSMSNRCRDLACQTLAIQAARPS
jgi:hypothetical protein